MIKAVMFDMGGTLEDLYSDEKNNRNTAHALYEILVKHGIKPPYEAEELWNGHVKPGFNEYKKYSEAHMRELKPEEIWADYAFKGLPVDHDKIAEISEEIALMWETTYYDRKLRDHAAEMLKGLKEDLGLYVGVISNTGSLFQVFSTLEKYGVRQYFDDITLSSLTGYRKPHPHIFETSLRQARLKPEECAYVGDTVSRDVVGSRKMGYGEVFQIVSFLTPQKDIGDYTGYEPDHKVDDIYDVYTILKKELGK